MFPPKHLSRIALLALACSLPASLLAATVSGTVTDRTTGKAAASDVVVLLSPAQGLQELARTTTDAHGRFSLDVSTPGPHLLRAEHGKVGYYSALQPNAATADIDVYDSAASVSDLRIEAHVFHVEADRQTARIAETWFVQNMTTHTQLGSGGFEVTLPPNAQPTAASTTDASEVTEPLTPMSRKSNRWALVCPLRPGETMLEIDYSLPWTAAGGVDFRTTPSLPTANLAVLLPNSMKLSGTAFHPISEGSGYQTFIDSNPTVGQAVAFTLSGTGAMPSPSQSASPDQASNGSPNSSPDASQSANANPGGGLGAPIGTPDPLYQNKWMILSGLLVLFAIAAGFLLRRRPRALPPALDSAQTQHVSPVLADEAAEAESASPFLQAIREELFLLEADHARGSITAAEYAQAKAALDLLLRRALAQRDQRQLVHQ